MMGPSGVWSLLLKLHTLCFNTFTQEWNQTADGKERFYITVEVLFNYAKYWKKATNIHALEELIAKQLSKIQMSHQIFAAPNTTFPSLMQYRSIPFKELSTTLT